MVDRAATAAAEIATLRQKLALAEARIQEMSRHTATEPEKRFASWKLRAGTLDDLRVRMAALILDTAKGHEPRSGSGDAPSGPGGCPLKREDDRPALGE